MEKRSKENILRVGLGPDGAGESHTSPSGDGRSVYTEGPLSARREEEKEEKRKKARDKKRADPKPVHLTAPARDPITDEDTDFSVPQPDAVRRLRVLIDKKIARGDTDGIRQKYLDFTLGRPVRDRSTDCDSEVSYSASGSNMSLDSGELPAPGRTTPLKRRVADDDEVAPSTSKATVPAPKRGRGRPPTTGQYVGYAKAQAEYNRQKEEALRLQAEEEVAETARRARRTWRDASSALAVLPASSPAREEALEKTGADMAKTVKEALETIEMIAKKSANLKGTFQKYLKESVTTIAMVFDEMRSRSSSEEIQRLEAQNARLEKQVANLRQELDEMRKRSSPPAGEDHLRELLAEVSRANVETFGNMLNARLAGLEDRLLPEPRRRPPLASDRDRDEDILPVPASVDVPMEGEAPGPPLPKAKGKPAKAKKAQPPVAAAAPQEAPATSTAPKGKKARKRKKRPSMAAQEAAKGGQNTNAPPAEAPWTTVGPRRPKEKKGAATPSKAAPRKKKKAKLRAPNTAAITVTLKASAAEKGVTYKDVLLKAKDAVGGAVQELGINRVGFRFRQAQTGARVLTIPGEGAQEKADVLAAKMREVLDPEVVKIGRPAKCVEMRIAGLDDSATTADVIEAVVREGGCPTTSIRSGPITKGRWGDGSLWLSVPVAAAKKLLSLGRLRVGWVSAKVTLLAARPKRCYRCLDTGHLATTCQCPVDRSRNCFRCGKPGHKAAECREKQPNCFFCEALGKEKDHVLGSSGCITVKKPLPSTKRRKRRGAPSDKARPKEPGAGDAGVSQPQPAMEVEP
ncbi:actin cytoskeleton-regulatory complex protein pan1-like [Aricia agestis]|uniref:actin cytoskeleton-regulatory complex protein pan1-like n=1 Tax=Aricia agestis TaxID=91739 RepID=UPI001C20A107|nr:actin cytoskeleton-regulatory complex protein pan1-like [Aricia agestis]